MNELKERLEKNYEHLKRAQVNYYLSAKHHAETKAHLDSLIITETLAGNIMGKNAAEREVSAKEFLGAAYQYVIDAKAKSEGDKIRLTVAQLGVDACRALIRIEEIKVGRLPDAGH